MLNNAITLQNIQYYDIHQILKIRQLTTKRRLPLGLPSGEECSCSKTSGAIQRSVNSLADRARLG